MSDQLWRYFERPLLSLASALFVCFCVMNVGRLVVHTIGGDVHWYNFLSLPLLVLMAYAVREVWRGKRAQVAARVMARQTR